MSALLDIYRAQMRTTLAVQLQYRVSLLIWLIGLTLEPIIYLVVWSTVARASGGSVGAFDQGDLAAYFIATFIVNHLTFTWHMWEYDYRIREGLLSPLLLRPIHPFHADLAENIGYKSLTLAVTLPTAVVLAFLFKPVYEFTAWSVALMIPALVMAFFLQFVLGWALALAAFWTNRIMAINRIYFLGKFFLGGQLAPLALLPPSLFTIATILPYRYMLSFPIELLQTRLTPAQALAGLAAQALWLSFSVILLRLMWRAGVKRYAAVGA